MTLILPKGSPSFNTSESTKYFHVTFRFLKILFHRLENPSILSGQGKYKYISPGGKIEAPFIKTNYVMFTFVVVNQDPSDPMKLVPNGFTSESFVCGTDLMPFLVPYVNFNVTLKRSGTPFSNSNNNKNQPTKAATKEFINPYILTEIKKFDMVSSSELDLIMIKYIFEVEMKVVDDILKDSLIKVCELKELKNGRLTTKYNINNLSKQPTSSICHIQYEALKKNSLLTMDLTIMDVITWCPNIKLNSILESATNRELLVSFKKECLQNPIQTFFFNSVIGNPKITENSRLKSLLMSDLKDQLDWLNLFSNLKYHVLFSVPRTKYTNIAFVVIKRDIFYHYLSKNREHKEAFEKIKKMYSSLKKLNKVSSTSSQNVLDTIFLEPPDAEVDECMEDLLKYKLIYKHELPFPDSPGYTIPFYKTHKNEWISRTIELGIKKILQNFECEKILLKNGTKVDVEFEVDGPSDSSSNNSNKVLNDTQIEVLNQIMNKKKSILCLTGGPGTGKTHVIKTLVKSFHTKQNLIAEFVEKSPDQSKTLLSCGNVLVISYVNTAASNLNEAGIAAYGIKALIADLSFKMISKNFLNDVKLVIIEEFSNFSEDVFSETCNYFMMRCPNLTQVVFVYDSDQINPIDPGCPSKSLEKAFSDSVIRLTTNYRVQDEYSSLLKNAQSYKSVKPWFDVCDIYLEPEKSAPTPSLHPLVTKYMTTSTTPTSSQSPWSPLVSSSINNTLTSIPEVGTFRIADKDAPTKFVDWFLKHESTGSILQETQFLCFQNVLIDSLNEKLDNGILKKNSENGKSLFPNFACEALEGMPISKNCKGKLKCKTIYTGQKIIFLENLPQKSTVQCSIVGLTPTSPIIECYLNLVGVVKGKIVRVKRIFKYYIGLKKMYRIKGDNRYKSQIGGEYTLILECIPVNDNSWSETFAKHYEKEEQFPEIIVSSENQNISNGDDTLEEVKDIFTKGEDWYCPNKNHQMFLNKAFSGSFFIQINPNSGITPNLVAPAWAMSVDKAQGRQNDTIVLNLMPNDGNCFTNEHGYVALTRAKKRLIICGSISTIFQMAKKPIQTRYTDLDRRLKKLRE